MSVRIPRLARALVLVPALVVSLVACRGGYHPLEVADRCACKPTEVCRVTPPAGGGAATTSCEPLPRGCGDRPTCDCVGTKDDACRDEDGRLTLIPTRAVVSCNDCSSDEVCFSGHEAMKTCRARPPQCDETPTCACFLETRRNAAELKCDESAGRLVVADR